MLHFLPVEERAAAVAAAAQVPISRGKWDTSCPDWEDRILIGQSLVPDLPLYEGQAAKALRCFKRLRLPDVIGTPTMGEACGPWFFPIVEALFGSYDWDTNTRFIKEVFQLIPKGNSKSSNGGAVMLVALIMNRRPEAEFLGRRDLDRLAGLRVAAHAGGALRDHESAERGAHRLLLRSLGHGVEERLDDGFHVLRGDATFLLHGGEKITLVHE